MKHVILLRDEERPPSPALLDALRDAGVAASTCVISEKAPEALTAVVAEGARQPFAILYEIGHATNGCAGDAAAYAAGAWPRSPLVACRRASADADAETIAARAAPDASTLARLGFSLVADDPAQLPAILCELARAGAEIDTRPPAVTAAPAIEPPQAVPLPAGLGARSLRAAFDFAAALNLATSQTNVARDALEKLASLVSADSWAIYLSGGVSVAASRITTTLELFAARGADVEGASLVEPSRKARAAFASAEVTTGLDESLHRLAAPLVAGGRVLGVLEASRGGARRPFGEKQVALVSALAAPLAAALANSARVAEAERLSQTDDLTKLHNARFLRQFLIAEVKRARRYGSPVSVLFFDLDDFKQINDRHGHLTGSHVLMELAGVILTCVRDTDAVARYGGDEFVIVLPETNVEQSARVAERLRERISTHAFNGGRPHVRLSLTASFGVANFPANAQSPQQLVAAADAAMYRAKTARKNRICYASEPAASLKSESF